MEKKKYVYGLLINGQGIIGKLSEFGSNPTEINAPAIIEIGVRPYQNPITGTADPKRASIVINCIPLPVTSIFLSGLSTVMEKQDVSNAMINTNRRRENRKHGKETIYLRLTIERPGYYR